VIINDLKQKRQKDYEFSWENALQSEGDSGIRLQYVHCRLSNIEKNSGVKVPKECYPEVLIEPEAIDLIRELALFDSIIERSRNELEACLLVSYLFNLSSSVNRAIKVLQVKDQPADVASQRLLLFHSAKLIMKRGLEILGVKPLNEM
jgi:arginyl-tRNA synthetase